MSLFPPSLCQAIGLYCVTNRDILSDYPEVGRYCVRKYLASLDAGRQRQIAATLMSHIDLKTGDQKRVRRAPWSNKQAASLELK